MKRKSTLCVLSLFLVTSLVGCSMSTANSSSDEKASSEPSSSTSSSVPSETSSSSHSSASSSSEASSQSPAEETSEISSEEAPITSSEEPVESSSEETLESSEEYSSEASSSSSPAESSSSTPAVKTVKSVTISDTTEYHVGEVYDPNKATVEVKYTDGSSEILESFSGKVNGSITDPRYESMEPEDPFIIAGKHSVPFSVRIQNKNYSKRLQIDVKSGFVSEGYTLNSIEFTKGIAFSLDHIVAHEFRDADLLLHWDKGDEHYHFDWKNDDKGITVSLHKQGVAGVDYLETPLESNSTYDLILTYKGVDYATSFKVYGNYYKLSGDSLLFMPSDIDKAVTPPSGEVRILIVPITISGQYCIDWPSGQLNSIEGYYFGSDPEKVSVKQYFETTSFGKVSIAGKMVSPYVETDASLNDEAIMADPFKEKLAEVFDNAIESLSNDPSIDLDDYDVNDDGILDNVHFVTNFSSKAYQKKTGYNASGTVFWPHRGRLQKGAGTKQRPVVDSYILSATDSAKDAITSIHEQGHNFGLDDYYDYAYRVNYIGSADMQSNSIFDWNSYSKFLVGWVSPYVVTGETEITIGAASLNGDCIVIPANPSTFNNSAYDEYFMIELFSEYGNNAINYPVNGVYQGTSFEYYNRRYGNLNGYGVRLYHVDSRMMVWNASTHSYYEASAQDKDKWLYLPIDNTYYDGGEEYTGYDDYKLLSLIQRGGVDTFGDPYGRQYLETEDLFREGDTFTFAQYKHFLSKSGKKVTAMDNGESFPYKITFTSMSAEKATVKIERI